MTRWKTQGFMCLFWQQHRRPRQEGQWSRRPAARPPPPVPASTEQPERETLLWRGAGSQTGRTRRCTWCPWPRECDDTIRKHHVSWEPPHLGLTRTLPPRQTPDRQTTRRWGRKEARNELQGREEVGRPEKKREQAGLGYWGGETVGKGKRLGMG